MANAMPFPPLFSTCSAALVVGAGGTQAVLKELQFGLQDRFQPGNGVDGFFYAAVGGQQLLRANLGSADQSAQFISLRSENHRKRRLLLRDGIDDVGNRLAAGKRAIFRCPHKKINLSNIIRYSPPTGLSRVISLK